MKKTVKTILICLLIGVLILPSFSCKSVKVELYDIKEIGSELTMYDLFNIAYHNEGIMKLNRKLQEAEYPDFKPKEIKRVSLFIKRKVKKALVEWYKGGYGDENLIYLGIKPIDFKVEYYGEYNGYYVCKYTSDCFALDFSGPHFPVSLPNSIFIRCSNGKNEGDGVYLSTVYIEEYTKRIDWKWIAFKVTT